MGFFAQQVKVIVIDDENSVTITKPSFGKRQDMLSPAAKIGKDEDTGEKVVIIDPATLQREQLCTWVTGWSGPGFEGREPTRANILALPPDIADKINTEIDTFNTPLSETEKNA